MSPLPEGVVWLEEQQVPYRIEKVTMFCYGEKEAWFKRLVPSGMLPALAIDGQLITESDRILLVLEAAFGPLGLPLEHPRLLELRQLERDLFRAWCTWLCYPGDEAQGQQLFEAQMQRVSQALERHDGPWFLESFSSADLIFVPYVERMNSSLLYYKGYELRRHWPPWIAGFRGLMAAALQVPAAIITHAHDCRRRWVAVIRIAASKRPSGRNESIKALGRGSPMPANQTRSVLRQKLWAACCGIGLCCCSNTKAWMSSACAAL